MTEEHQPESTPDALLHWALTCNALGATTKKLEKKATLATYLRTLPVLDAARAALYVAGQSFAEADRRNLNIGGSLLSKAVAERSGASPAALTQAFRRHGDIGAAAEELIAGSSRAAEAPPMVLGDLEALLTEAAGVRGPAPKLRLLQAVLARANALECKYILKLISGDMRIGVKQSLVEEAIAAAFHQEVDAVRHAGMLLGSLPEVVDRAASGTLSDAEMRLFHPLGFMLASPVDSVEEAVARFAEEVIAEAGETGQAVEPPEQLLREAQLEDKYDGMRAQLHAGDAREPGRVGLFSRNREDLSAAFPELIETFAALPEPVILDGEILAWSPATVEQPARALPFSALQQRLGRKQVSEDLRRTRPVIFMAFDILYADGRLLLDRPLAERRARLVTYLEQHGGKTDGRAPGGSGQASLFGEEAASVDQFSRLLLAPAVQLQGAAQLDDAYLEARARGNEGVMLKSSHSAYQPGRRGLAWLKIKRELATLDVVVTGAEFGSGRRAGYLSDYTFAVQTGDGELVNIGKAYSGVTDLEMQELSRHFHETTLEDLGHFRTVEPDTVFEVAFNNITRSDRHASGFALRFPRILRIRTDKPVSEIDTLERVEQVYHEQPDRPVELG